MNKVCFKCGIEKPLTEFYKHKRMGDGHLNKCKECTKKDTNERETYLRESDPDFVMSEKIRGREKYRRLYSEVRSSGEVKKKSIETYKNRFPEKREATWAAGKIECPDNCERHHWSYNEEHYLDVIILPNSLHKKIHRYMTYDQSEKKYRTLEGTLLDSRQQHELFISKIADLF